MWFCSSKSKETSHVSVGGLHAQGRALTGMRSSSSLVTHHWKAKALHSQLGGHETITVTWSAGFSVSRNQTWAGTYPSASSIGSGGAWREADGRTVLVPRDTLSCSVFADREAMEMGWSRVVVMPVVTVRLWPEPLRVRSGVGRSGLRILTRQKAEPLLGMKFTLFLSGQ